MGRSRACARGSMLNVVEVGSGEAGMVSSGDWTARRRTGDLFWLTGHDSCTAIEEGVLGLELERRSVFLGDSDLAFI